MNKLIFLEDNLNYFRHLFNHISNNVNDVKLANVFVNGEELIGNLSRYCYEDILLIDLDSSEVDCNSLLECLKYIHSNLPAVIIISENVEFLNLAKSYNYVYKVIKKPLTFSSVSDTIYNIVQDNKMRNISMVVKKELKFFHFNPSTVGYSYLTDSIKLALNNKDLLRNTKSLLFKEVGKLNNKTSDQIKWNIDKCIETVYKTTNINVINDYFYLTEKDKLSSKKFISGIVNHLYSKIYS